jgi:TusA-related sulfurtransferase
MSYELVDVRDMQCAQALAQAARAMRRLADGEVLALVCNAEDVRDDLLAWAEQVGHRILSAEARNGDTRLTIQKR